MIKIAIDGFDIEPFMNGLSDPYGCRIEALYRTYSYELPFVDYWVQLRDSEPTALIARLEDAVILRITENSDLEELTQFVRFLSPRVVCCDGKYTLGLGGKRREGTILMSDKLMPIHKGFELFEPSLREAYDVISESESENFTVPPFENFFVDTVHRLKKHTSRLYVVRLNGEVAACIMTFAENKYAAVPGALSVRHKFRGMGLGSFLISRLNNDLINEGRTVYFHRAPNENIEFYARLGFTPYGTWAEYYQR